MTTPDAPRSGFFSLLKWPLVLGLVAALLGGGWLLHQRLLAERAAEAERDKPQVNPPSRLGDRILIRLDDKKVDEYGLRIEPAEKWTWKPQLTVFGRVVTHPRMASEVRTASAGVIRPAGEGEGPALGKHLDAGHVLAYLDVRVTPQDRLDLLVKLGEAEAREKETKNIVEIQNERVTRLQAAPRSVSQGELDAARKDQAEARLQQAAAESAAGHLRKSVKALEAVARGDSVWRQPLTTPAAGILVEITARPGTAVEAGALVARLLDDRKALVRLDFPVAVLADGPPESVELTVVDATPPSLEGASHRLEPVRPKPGLKAVRLGPAAQVDAASQLAGWWYEIDLAALPSAARGLWRPGLYVKTSITAPGVAPVPATAVPSSAILYHQGRALVYVQYDEKKPWFEKREVHVLGHVDDRWVLQPGSVDPGEPVVARRAQMLLSHEFLNRGDDDDDKK
jgi:multidrug efflux pump subunit AcrA (membrane-fusion protein)